MKKCLKRICVSVVSVLLLNIIFFSILTVVQAPYYDDAPSQVDSIYELYASEEYDDVVYTSPNGILSDKLEIQRVEAALKSVSSVKLNKAESYLRMLSLDKSDFVLKTSNNFNREKAKKTIVASNILVYSKNDTIYIICHEFKYGVLNAERVVYKAENSEFVELFTEYKSPSNDGFAVLQPRWRQNFSEFPVSYNARMYVLSFFVEFVIALIITRIIQKNRSKKRNETKNDSKPLKKCGIEPSKDQSGDGSVIDA